MRRAGAVCLKKHIRAL